MRKHKAAAVLCCFVCLYGPVQAQGTRSRFDPVGRSANELALEAQSAFEALDFDRVIFLMNYALTLELNPIDRRQEAALRSNLGLCYALRDQLDPALQNINLAIKLYSEPGDFYFRRSFIFVKMGKLDEAWCDLSVLEEKEPANWRVPLVRSRLFMWKKRSAEALTAINQAVKLNAKCADCYAQRASIYYRRNEPERAIADAETALNLSHDSRLAYTTRANAEAQLGKIEQANNDLREAARVKDGSEIGSVENGIAWLRATNPNDQVRNGTMAVQLAKKACDKTAWRRFTCIDTLAAAYAESGDFDRAIKYQKQAVELASKYPPPNFSELKDRLQKFERRGAYRDTLKF